MKLVSTLVSKQTVHAIAFLLLILPTSHAFGNNEINITAPPVFWNVFDADVNKDKVTLTWIVTEYNNKGFYIEHSINGTDWETIDSVHTKNSALTLDEYTYIHVNKTPGRQYYRVKQIDIDLTRIGYSKVVMVVLDKVEQSSKTESAVSLWPNPAIDQVKILTQNNTNTNYKKAVVFDLSGKKVAEKNLEAHSNTVDIRELPRGIFIMRLETTDGTYFSQKIIKQ